MIRPVHVQWLDLLVGQKWHWKLTGSQLTDIKCQFLFEALIGKKKRRKEGRSEKELIYVHWGRDSLLIELAFLPFIWIQKQALESHLWVNERKKVSALIPLNNLYYILSLHSLPPPPCVSLSSLPAGFHLSPSPLPSPTTSIFLPLFLTFQ